MKIEVNILQKLDECGAVGKGLKCSGQALAFILPYIIEDKCKDFSILHLSNKLVIEHKITGKRYKVCSSNSSIFNINPSYTKGIGRNDFGVNCKHEISEYADGVVFCFVKDLSKVIFLFKDLKNIELTDKGIVDFGGEY